MKVLESNNEQTTISKIKHLMYQFIFYALSIAQSSTNFELETKELFSLGKVRIYQCFFAILESLPWRWSYVWVCCHVSRTCSDDVNRNFKIVPEMRWLALSGRNNLFRTNGTVHADSRPKFEWKNEFKILWIFIVFNSVFSTF